ncbi:MAG: 4-hydroxy-tetrahydrodipicolinate synthase [Thermomicrobiaceae bacterium]|nr:4-hydroxy-tetrahydrodipicolinate synthase [Thermomicrobiaceae bacterium]
MARKHPVGIFAPVATPFDASGDLALDRFRENLEWYATSALDGIAILGSNGEYPSLTTEEKLRLIQTGVETIAGRKPVIAGTGTESTRGTIELTRAAAEMGADFALVVTPYYYKPRYDRAAYVRHYHAVADASPIPVIVYVMAAYTGVDLPVDTVVEIARHPNIVGIKDSGGNAPKVAEMVARTPDDFSVLAGSANFLYPALCLGGRGGILALGNVAPEQCAAIARAVEAGDHEAARAMQFRLLAPNAAVTTRFGIAGLKAAMDLVGLYGGDPRPPLLPLSEAERAEVRRVMEEAGIVG